MFWPASSTYTPGEVSFMLTGWNSSTTWMGSWRCDTILPPGGSTQGAYPQVSFGNPLLIVSVDSSQFSFSKRASSYSPSRIPDRPVWPAVHVRISLEILRLVDRKSVVWGRSG